MKRGAHPKYDPKTTPKKTLQLAKAGGRDKDIAKALKVSEATLNNWKKKYPELLEPLKVGKDEVDEKVVSALLRNALGYVITETKRFYKPLFAANGDPVIGQDGRQVKALIREEVTEKEVAPATIAQIFWLKNRRPDEWRQNDDIMGSDKQKGEVKLLFDKWKTTTDV